MILLERVAALLPTSLLLLAAGSLLDGAARVERHAALQLAADRPVLEASRVLQALVDRRAPGVSVRVLASGVGLRVIRAEGSACADVAGPVVPFRRRWSVRAPVAGDSVMRRTADGSWQTMRVDAVSAATCADGAPAWLLTSSAPFPAVATAELLIVEWLDVGLSSTAPTALAIRHLGATARQPAVGPLPTGAVLLEVQDSAGTPLAAGASTPPAVLELRHATPRRGSSLNGVRIAVRADAD